MKIQAIPGEYAGKAQEVDERFCGAQPGAAGPVTRKLQSFGAVKGLVFGAWGETSPDVEKLLSLFARTGAIRHWRSMRCNEEASAVGALAWLLRRRWALTALRENARVKLDRMAHVGRGAVAAAQRRQDAEASYATLTG